MKLRSAALLLPLLACGKDHPVHHGPHVLADWSRATGLYAAPFPSDDLGAAMSATQFPDPPHAGMVEQARALVGEDGGFSTTSGVYFQLSDAIDPSQLPDVAGSVSTTSIVQLIRVDATLGSIRVPGEVTFTPAAGTYGAPNLVSFVPLAGTPLLPGARYAAVILTDLKTTAGLPFEPANSDDLAPFSDVLPAIAAKGIDQSRIAGLTVFTVGDPTAGLARGRHAALNHTQPVPGAFTLTDTFTDFCVYHATIAMPDFQTGTPPFDTAGGTWDGANPSWQRDEMANLVVTIPRTTPPAAGFPLVVYVRAGDEGDRPLVDRGQQATAGGAPIETGEGPARYFARAGFAGLQVDGPLGGMRNPSGPGADEDALIFNLHNLGAVRDTLRESAIELDVMAHVATTMHLAATDCLAAGTSNPGPADVSFDQGHVAIMGHGTGAWIAALAVAEEPIYKAMILSGAGGSFAQTFLWKQKPAPVLPTIEAAVQETQMSGSDPVLGFVQWALEPADPQVYTRTFQARAGDVLMIQGVVDNFALPNIANATSLSLGLQLAGTELDTGSDPRLAGQRALGPLLTLAGASTVTLPYPGTAAGTRAVVQVAEDGIEDGHEVVFQVDAPKHQYQCYLASWIKSGQPTVDVAAARDAACP